jgi:hypothetical protein
MTTTNSVGFPLADILASYLGIEIIVERRIESRFLYMCKMCGQTKTCDDQKAVIECMKCQIKYATYTREDLFVYDITVVGNGIRYTFMKDVFGMMMIEDEKVSIHAANRHRLVVFHTHENKRYSIGFTPHVHIDTICYAENMRIEAPRHVFEELCDIIDFDQHVFDRRDLDLVTSTAKPWPGLKRVKMTYVIRPQFAFNAADAARIGAITAAMNVPDDLSRAAASAYISMRAKKPEIFLGGPYLDELVVHSGALTVVIAGSARYCRTRTSLYHAHGLNVARSSPELGPVDLSKGYIEWEKHKTDICVGRVLRIDYLKNEHDKWHRTNLLFGTDRLYYSSASDSTVNRCKFEGYVEIDPADAIRTTLKYISD